MNRCSFVPTAIAAGLVGVLLGGYLFVRLGWQALGSLLDRPRVPLAAVTYLVLCVLCAGFLALGFAGLGTAFLFRDHASVKGSVRLAELACERIAPGRVRLTLKPLAPAEGPTESYELETARCDLSVEQVQLQPLLARALGAEYLSRVSQAGIEPRPRRNPEWLTPAAEQRLHPLKLIVRQTRRQAVVAEPRSGARYVLTTSDAGPALVEAGS